MAAVSFELAQGVRLTCIQSYKFKTGALSISLICPLERKTASMNALLPYLLVRGSALHPDTESLEAALDDLYGARLEPVVRKRGEAQCIGLYADFVDEAFTERGLGLVEKVAELMGEVLLMPATGGGRLRRDYLETERENLIADINAAVNDKRGYASLRLLETMCAGEKYGVPKLGGVKEAERISVGTLTKHYRELIATAPVEVIYIGSADPFRMERAVRGALSGLPRRNVAAIPETEVRLEPAGEVREVSETMEVSQAKLAVGYRIGEAMKSPNHAALMVANALFGGSATSRLYLGVRERLGLCYYISSAIDRHKGIMAVSAGIDKERKDEALEEITRQLDALSRGEFEEWELESAKKTVASSILSAADSQPGLESMYLDLNLRGMGILPEELAEFTACVTAEDVVRVFKGVRRDTVFLLAN